MTQTVQKPTMNRRVPPFAGHRVGNETILGGETLLTRVKRKPPTWHIKKYTPKGEFYLMLVKAEKGAQKGLRWTLMGEGYVTMHSTRRSALRAAQGLQPALEADCLHCGQVIPPGETYCDDVCRIRGPGQ